MLTRTDGLKRHFIKVKYVSLVNLIANRGAFNGFQLTGVWGDTFANGLCTFSGFLDVWYDKDVCGKLIVLSEPQFWFNLYFTSGFGQKSGVFFLFGYYSFCCPMLLGRNQLKSLESCRLLPYLCSVKRNKRHSSRRKKNI